MAWQLNVAQKCIFSAGCENRGCCFQEFPADLRSRHGLLQLSCPCSQDGNFVCDGSPCKQMKDEAKFFRKRFLGPRHRVSPSPREKENQWGSLSMGIRGVTSSTPCLTSMVRVERSVLKSAFGANKFISALDRIFMKLQSQLGGFT
eukprot:195334-Pelagomonas_calceolata.AAC.1